MSDPQNSRHSFRNRDAPVRKRGGGELIHKNYRFWSAIADLTTRRARTVLVLAAMLGLVSMASTARLRPVATMESVLADHEPSAEAFRQIIDDFGAFEECIVLASLKDTDSTNDGPSKLLDFALRLEQDIASSTQLSTMCDAVRFRPSDDMRSFVETAIIPRALLYMDDGAVESLVERLGPEQMREQIRRTEERLFVPGVVGRAVTKAAIKDPLGLRDFLVTALPAENLKGGGIFSANDGFFSVDRRHLLIRLRGTKPASDLDFAKAFLQAVQMAAQDANEFDLELAYTGAYAIATTAQQSIRSDMIRSIVLSVLFLQVLYLIAYRSLWALPATLAPVALGLLCAFGAFSAMGMNLSPITAVIGAILAGLGIDYCIHSLSHYQNARANGCAHLQAIQRTLTEIGPALIAACVTTTIGFLAISQSSVRALREFGLLGAMGLVASLLAAIVILPAVLTMASKRSERALSKQSHQNSIVARFLRHAVRHRRVFITSGGVFALVGAAAFFVQADRRSIFEDDLTVMHPRPNRPLEVQQRLSEWFEVAPDSLLIHLTAESEHALTTLAHQVENRLQSTAQQDPNIIGSFGLASLLPDPSLIDRRSWILENVHVDQILTDFDAAIAQSNLNADAFDGYKTFLGDLLAPGASPNLSDLKRFAALAELVLPIHDSSKTPGDLQAVTAVITAKPLGDRAIRDQAINTIRLAIGDLEGATLTGVSVLGHDTEKTIRRDLVKLISVAAVAVSLWLVFFFRTIGAALLALVPAVFGFIVLLSFATLFGLKLNMINLVALPLLIGIGVDDGIFLVTIARSSRRRVAKPRELLEDLSTGCHAVGMTSLTTLLTFGTLIFTSTPAIRSLGLLMAIGVAGSLVGTIWILAPMLTMQTANRDPKQP